MLYVLVYGIVITTTHGKHSCTYRILYNQKQGMGRIGKKSNQGMGRIQQIPKAMDGEDSTTTQSKGWGGFNNNSMQGVGWI